MTAGLLERPAKPVTETGARAEQATLPIPELVTAVDIIPAETPAKSGRKTRELPVFTGQTRPVLDSEWRVYVRDHAELDINMTEWGLATLYGTYGNWGQKAYPSDRWVSRRFGCKPETVGRAREALLSKGLIECTGTVAYQPSQRIYRLCLPMGTETEHQLVVGDPNGDTPVTPETDHRDPNKGSQDIQRSREDLHHDGVTTLRVENHDEDEGTGELPGSLATVSARREAASRALARVEGRSVTPSGKREAQCPARGIGEEGKQYIAELLGVPLASIGSPLWRWFDALGIDSDSNESVAAVTEAARAANGKRNPVGYFKAVLPDFLDRATKMEAEVPEPVAAPVGVRIDRTATGIRVWPGIRSGHDESEYVQVWYESIGQNGDKWRVYLGETYGRKRGYVTPGDYEAIREMISMEGK
jgi:hypothetical protein